jgi:hypothetical protein
MTFEIGSGEEQNIPLANLEINQFVCFVMGGGAENFIF